MNGFDVYYTYNSIKLHFETDGYNFFHYGGKSRASTQAFEKRKDKYLFHRLGRRYNESEIVSFLVANFVHSNKQWVKDLLNEEASDVYREWKRITDPKKMQNIYTKEIQSVATKDTFNDLFKVEDGKHPKLLTLHMQKEVSLETMVVLHSLFGFIKIWDKKISDDIVYPKISRKIKKYSSFLVIDTERYKSLTKIALLSGEDTI